MAKYLAKGTALLLGSGLSPETFTAIVQLTKVPTPGRTRAKVDVTDHDSLNSKQYVPETLYDLDVMAVEGHWDPAAATQGKTTGVEKVFNDGTVRNWQVTIPTTPVRTFAFAAFVSKAPAADVDFNSKLPITFELQPTSFTP
jgi:hypothetical protein